MQNNDSQKDNNTTTESTIDSQESANKDAKENNSTNSSNKDNISANSSKTEKSTNRNIGLQRKAAKSIPTNGIYANIDESEVTGLIMKFSGDGARFGNQSFQNPKYAITNLSTADFRKEYRREPPELGLSGDTMICVSVNTTGEQPKLSNGFIVKDNNTLIVLKVYILKLKEHYT